jgi:acetate---CoA ligase (ADP-forming)
MALPAHPLAPLLEPRGVAVVGASETPGKYGYILLKTLIDEGYAGAAFGVNPRGGGLPGRPFLKSLADADAPIDVALVVRPAQECLAAITEIAALRIPFAIVYAAGFAEHGAEGLRLEREMVAAAARGGTRLVGPNGMNIFSAAARLNLSAIVPFPVGGLGFLSASGNLGYALAQEAATRGQVGFSRFISVGNQADLALDEYLDVLRVDPETRAILVYAEGFVAGRARAFLDVLARTASEKPVLILRGGRTAAGQGTARSHTGALAGESAVVREALLQAGAVLVERADEVLPIAQAFLESPLPRGPRIALVGEGGGHATLLSDAASEAGLRVESLPAAVVEAVRPHLPPFAAIVANPVEMGGISEYDIRVYERVLDPVLDWEGCDLALLFGGYALYDEALVAHLARRRRETGKPILLHDLYADEDREAFRALRRVGLPLYASADVAARAAAALARGTAARARAVAALAPATLVPVAVPTGLRAVLDAARGRKARALSEDEAARLLAHFGLPVLPSALVRDADEAVVAAPGLGFPLVAKAHAPDLVHKSDAGGVRLDLRGPDELRSAVEALCAIAPEVRLTPFRPGGLEVLVGARRDPQFGPILLFGAGGVLAEVVADAAIRTLPCSEAECGAMIAATRLARLFDRPRGGPPRPRAPVVAALAALGRMISALPEIEDVEINPLSCRDDGAIALDARVLVSA